METDDLSQLAFHLGMFLAHLGKAAEDLADELSAGQKQKLAIALALSKEADLYVFDEPLAARLKRMLDTRI